MAAGAAGPLDRRVPGGIVTVAGSVALLVALPFLIFEPASTDLAAQTFRADLWSRSGWVLWSEAWYSGFLVPGYSILYPPLGALVGSYLVGVVAAVVSAAAFAALVRRERPGPGVEPAALWLALGSGAMVYTGRVTFMLGLALSLLALLALRKPAAALPLAAAAALAAPLAGLFTALAGAALLLAGRIRSGLPIAAGAGVALAVLIVAFPTGGSQPFELSSLWATAIFLVVALALPLWRERPELRVVWVGLVLYALLVAAAFLVPTPIGNNVSRLAALLAGPLAAALLFERHRILLLVLAAPLLWWQLGAPIRDFATGQGDPSTEAAYYEPLLTELDEIAAAADGRPFRIAVPVSRNRWEAAYVGERYPLARGWMRQLEADDIEARDAAPPTATDYRAWLDRHGVSFVALSDARRDYLSAPEAALLRAGLPYLHEIWSNGDWRLWKVRGSGPAGAPLASAGAVVTELAPDRFAVRVRGPGEYMLRVRHSPYMEVAAGVACVESVGGASTLLSVPEDAPAPETIRVQARLSVDGLLRRDRSCSG